MLQPYVSTGGKMLTELDEKEFEISIRKQVASYYQNDVISIFGFVHRMSKDLMVNIRQNAPEILPNIFGAYAEEAADMIDKHLTKRN